jgi:hypothetical protein
MNGSFLAEKKLHARIADGRITTLFGHCCLHGTAGSAVSGILGFVPAAAQVSPGTIGGPFKQEEADGDITL